ncbi:hypothetical protein [Terrisporobacter sp.]
MEEEKKNLKKICISHSISLICWIIAAIICFIVNEDDFAMPLKWINICLVFLTVAMLLNSYKQYKQI